jgi:3-oxoacyl-[acyl-carrier-protein] synthase II
MKPNIVVTGIGIVTPVSDPQGFILQGRNWNSEKSEIKREELMAELLSARCSRGILRQMDVTQQMVLLSCVRALSNGGIQINKLNRKRVSIILGTEYGDLEVYETFYETFSPMPFRSSLPSTPGLAASIALKFFGHSMTVLGRYCAGLDAIIHGIESIEDGSTDIVLAGGFEKLSKTILKRISAMDLLSKRGISAPFDKNRDGITLMEGSGILLLEREQNALDRGSKIFAHIAGYGRTFGASQEHISSSMKQALSNAHMRNEEVDVLFASANSSYDLDREEALACMQTLPDTSVTAVKSITGEPFGFGGAFNLIAGITSLQKNIIPPTINCREFDPELTIPVISSPIEKELSTIMVNAIGTNSVSILIKKGEIS